MGCRRFGGGHGIVLGKPTKIVRHKAGDLKLLGRHGQRLIRSEDIGKAIDRGILASGPETDVYRVPIDYASIRGPRIWCAATVYRLKRLWVGNVHVDAIAVILNVKPQSVRNQLRTHCLPSRVGTFLIRDVALARKVDEGKAVAQSEIDLSKRAAQSNKMFPTPTWKDPEIARLIHLWHGNFHHSCIAQVLEVTPSSVSSVASRRNFPARARPSLIKDVALARSYDAARPSADNE